MSVFATFAMWQPAHWATVASAANLSYGNGWWPKVKKPQPLVFAKRLLSFAVIEAVRRQWSSHEHPLAETCRHSRPAVGLENHRRLLRIGDANGSADRR